jgi:WD40 repeat protein
MKKWQLVLVAMFFSSSLFCPTLITNSELANEQILTWYSQDSEAENISGCTNLSANNYNPNATYDDGSCDYDLDDDGVLDVDEIPGCTDSRSFRLGYFANNYNPNATDDDGSCNYDIDGDGVLDVYEVPGCTDSNISNGMYAANNYNPNATDDDGSCDYDLDDDGILDVDEVYGCTDQFANNHDINATEDDGGCDYSLIGSFQIIEYQTNYENYTVNDVDLYSIKYSPDGRYYATQHQHLILVWEVENNSNATVIDINGKILDFDWSPDGQQIATISTYKQESYWVDFYDFETGEISYFFVNNYSIMNYGIVPGDIEYSPDGNHFAISYHNNTSVYNSSSNELVWSYESPISWSYSSCNYWENCYSYPNIEFHFSVSWSADGERFAFSSGHLFYLFNTSTWNEIMHTSPFEEYDHPIVESISISPNSELIASCSNYGGLAVMNISDGNFLWVTKFGTFDICSEIIWSHDSSKVAVSYGNTGYYASSVVILSSFDGGMQDVLRVGTYAGSCYDWSGCPSVGGFDWSLDGQNIITTISEASMGIYHWELNESIPVYFGCTIEYAMNYDPNATKYDDSCYFYTYETPNTNNTYSPGIPHSGSDVGFPAITDSDGGMNMSFGPSDEEIMEIMTCCVLLFFVGLAFIMNTQSRRNESVQFKNQITERNEENKSIQATKETPTEGGESNEKKGGFTIEINLPKR